MATERASQHLMEISRISAAANTLSFSMKEWLYRRSRCARVENSAGLMFFQDMDVFSVVKSNRALGGKQTVVKCIAAVAVAVAVGVDVAVAVWHGVRARGQVPKIENDGGVCCTLVGRSLAVSSRFACALDAERRVAQFLFLGANEQVVVLQARNTFNLPSSMIARYLMVIGAYQRPETRR